MRIEDALLAKFLKLCRISPAWWHGTVDLSCTSNYDAYAITIKSLCVHAPGTCYPLKSPLPVQKHQTGPWFYAVFVTAVHRFGDIILFTHAA
jgi:hypothetical protein